MSEGSALFYKEIVVPDSSADVLTKAHEKDGLGFGGCYASLILLAILIVTIFVSCPNRNKRKPL